MTRVAETTLETAYGELQCLVYRSGTSEGVVLVKAWKAKPIVRIQSSCLFSESFRSKGCDCALQLDSSLREIYRKGGILIYLYQEGRGYGLATKVKGMQLSLERGINTADAYVEMGLETDPRTYELAIEVLNDLSVPKRFLFATNNPKKLEAVRQAGYKPDRYQLSYSTTPEIDSYIESKVAGLGHIPKSSEDA
ncbi:MAG: hypothetical protein AB7I04_08485 [Pseudomonadales bacterium]